MGKTRIKGQNGNVLFGLLYCGIRKPGSAVPSRAVVRSCTFLPFNKRHFKDIEP